MPMPLLPAQKSGTETGRLLAMAAEKLAVCTLVVITTNRVLRVPCASHLLPRVALCEVAPLEVVLRNLVHVAPGAFRHVLPRHLDVDLTKNKTLQIAPDKIKLHLLGSICYTCGIWLRRVVRHRGSIAHRPTTHTHTPFFQTSNISRPHTHTCLLPSPPASLTPPACVPMRWCTSKNVLSSERMSSIRRVL